MSYCVQIVLFCFLVQGNGRHQRDWLIITHLGKLMVVNVTTGRPSWFLGRIVSRSHHMSDECVRRVEWRLSSWWQVDLHDLQRSFLRCWLSFMFHFFMRSMFDYCFSAFDELNYGALLWWWKNVWITYIILNGELWLCLWVVGCECNYVSWMWL